MIDENTTVFPNNISDILAIRLQTLDVDLRVFKRGLRTTDPSEVIGIFAQTWTPDNDSIEMKNYPSPAQEPTLSRYQIMVQAFVKDFDQSRGQAKHSVLSKMVRSMLYRDTPLRVGLAALSVSMNGSTESAKRFGVSRVTYLSNEINNDFVFLSTLEFWLETETV